MKELVGKRYSRLVLNIVSAAEIPEDVEFDRKLFLKGDFVLRYDDCNQKPMKREKFLKEYKLCLMN